MWFNGADVGLPGPAYRTFIGRDASGLIVRERCLPQKAAL